MTHYCLYRFGFARSSKLHANEIYQHGFLDGVKHGETFWRETAENLVQQGTQQLVEEFKLNIKVIQEQDNPQGGHTQMLHLPSVAIRIAMEPEDGPYYLRKKPIT